ncbi:beta strand repeat-containing protein, partial [Acinetobacter nectaris]|uniref:beta strand repeat-containing protein n=1 Tax=Acinetobacter nectaris TaxID=1219382 RepID=UPI001F1A6F5D
DKITYALNRNLDVDSVKAGNSTLDTTGLTTTDSNGNSTQLTASGTSVQGKDSSGNAVSATYGADQSAFKSGTNTTTTTAAGTSVTGKDSSGNSVTAIYGADKNALTSGSNTTTADATGTTTKDGSGNTNATTATATSLDDGAKGNSNTLTATGSTLKDASGNQSATAASGFNVTDKTGQGTTVSSNGVTVANGPSLTTSGIDAANKKISNLQSGSIADGSTDAVTGGQVAQIQEAINSQIGTLGSGAVQYAKNSDGSVNYNSIVAGNGKGTAITTGKDQYGNTVVTSGGTTISNVANGTSASDAVNKGQLDSEISKNITNVKDANGDAVNVTDQVVNQNYSATNPDKNSLFLTYDKSGQTTTDQLTIGETVQKMNTEGVKFAHTNSTDGQDSSAAGANSTALGVNAIASEKATNSVVIGNNSSVTGTSSVAIGDGAVASGTQSISVGTGNNVTGNHSGAFGDPSTITGNESYVLGNNNTISTDNTFALGNDITQTTAGSVVLGNNSASRTASGVSGYTPTAATTADQAAITATTSTTGSVAVGDAQNNIYRQVTGVAAGTADSDAVNVAQLKAVDNKVLALKTDGNTISDSTGNTNQSTATSNTLSGKDAKDNPINAQTTAAGLKVSTKDSKGNDITSASYGANSAKYTNADGSSSTVGGNGLAFADTTGAQTGPSITAQGIDAGNQRITNVATGTISSSSKDAVNGGQVASISQSVANAIGGVKVNQDGTISNPTYNIAGGSQTNISDALNALNTAVQNANTTGKDINVSKVSVGNAGLDTNGLTVANGSNSTSTTAAGVAVQDSAGNSANYSAQNASLTDANGNKVITTAAGTTYGYANNQAATVVNQNGLSFKDASGNATGPSVTASGINAGGKTVTGVAAGVNATDAVNKGQLDTAVNTVSNTVNTLSNAAVQYDKNADGSVNKGRVSLGDGTNPTTLTNVADGTVAAGSKDAVNGGQLANVQSQVTANTNSIN